MDFRFSSCGRPGLPGLVRNDWSRPTPFLPTRPVLNYPHARARTPGVSGPTAWGKARAWPELRGDAGADAASDPGCIDRLPRETHRARVVHAGAIGLNSEKDMSQTRSTPPSPVRSEVDRAH